MSECRRATPGGASALVADLIAVVVELSDPHGSVDGVGVGLPGLVDRGGSLRMAPHLPGVVDLEVVGPLAAASGLPVQVDNDATCALVAEHRLGAARDVSDAILVTLGTGIGGGLLLGGQVHRGRSGFAGELGHLVVDPEGRACACGRRGCWETYASGQALDGRVAASGGELHLDAVLVPFAAWVALGLANLVQVLDVERVILGGGLAGLGERLLAPVRSAFLEQMTVSGSRPEVAVVGATLGESAGAVGAALLVRGHRQTPRGGTVRGG